LARHSPYLRGWQDKLRVIPFGIDTEEWGGVKRRQDGPFLFVGRLVYYKGAELLLATLNQLPEVELVLVGEGPLRAKLEQMALRNGLRSRIRFTGNLSPVDLRREMEGACALILPSVQASETFGLVQLEAMAAGLPVISTRLPTGVAEVNRDGETGRVVAPGDAVALAKAMAEIKADVERANRWGEAGRRRAQTCFSRESMIDGLEKWYRDLSPSPDHGDRSR
jgi:rhamnosyl/mannosyltransferase